MGWTWTHASAHEYGKYGKPDRIECAKNLLAPGYLCIDADLYGSVVYMAVKDVCSGEISAVVVKTATKKGHYYDFGYKVISEDMGPCYYDCPKRILKLLTPSTNTASAEWRDKCYKKLNDMSVRRKTLRMPIGTKIQVDFDDDRGMQVFEKIKPCAQFKTPVWFNFSRQTYLPKHALATVNYKVMEKEETHA